MTTAADDWTPARLEAVYHAALGAGDVRGVEAALTLLAVRAPARAQHLVDITRAALDIARPIHGHERTGTMRTAPPSATQHAEELEQYHRAATGLLHRAQPAIAAWRTARVRLAASYAAVDTAPDGLWRARVASLVGAREGARVAALAVDDVDAEYDRLQQALPAAARAHASSLDELAAAVDLPPLEPGDLPDRGASCSADLEQAIRAQDAHIAEINRLAGLAGDGPADAVLPG